MQNTEIITKLIKSFSSVIPNKTDNRIKLSCIQLVSYIVFHFLGDNKQSSIEGMRRKIMLETKITISRSAFWDRLAGNRMKIILESLIEQLMANTVGTALIAKDMLKLLNVTGIFLLDSTSIKLPNSAEEHFEGTRNKSGIKWHVCLDLFSGKQIWYTLSESRKHDSNFFPSFELLKNKLIIFDLGYFDYQLLKDLVVANVFFLCRLKSNAVVFIKEIGSGFTEDCLGKSLLSFNRYQGNILSAVIEKKLQETTLNARAIGFWNSKEKRYHWYLTNLLVNEKFIYPLYRLRWQIELIFKACKNSLNINAINSSNPNIIQSLLLASIVAHLSSHSIYEIALNALSPKEILAISFQRIAYILASFSAKFIKCIITPIQENVDNLIQSILHMKHELYDPNYKNRKTSKINLYEILVST